MEQPALLRSSFFCLLLLALVGCHTTPEVWVRTNGADFETRGGITYLDGTPFNGAQFDLYPTGDTAFFVHYVDGHEEGVAKKWFANGQLQEERFFRKGKKEGEHRAWFDSGKPRFVFHYKDDLFHGNVKEWQPSGLLYRNFHYLNGYEQGLQQMWESDGRLKANYEVRDGRKYGLTGSKNCLSTHAPGS